ncbi:hypothetical protein SNE40_016883 [Patella caerulea]|uniref:Sorbitol dehydrogenase n=1 Tax=Patella caerulea TaxID=87958 RepID=A0AAN8J9E0_PATCE
MANSDNTAAVLHAANDLRMESISVPEPKDTEVLISMGSVGICGSDIKYWALGKCGKFVVKEPMVLGHEASGVVVGVGSKVTHLKEGDRVAIEPGIPCRSCNLCKKGRYNLCPGVEFCATPPIDGNLCRLYKHPADFCFKLPDHVSLDEGAMLEPLSVAVYSCKRAEIDLGSTVLVCGAGPIGLLAMMVAKNAGATNIMITDIDEHRLNFAKKMGADHIFKIVDKDGDVVARKVSSILGEPDVTLDCSGVDSSFILGIQVTRPGGKVVRVGGGSPKVELPLTRLNTNEVDLLGIFRYANCYPIALDLIASGALNVKPLISHHFTLLETEKAFLTASDRNSQSIKVIIHCDR